MENWYKVIVHRCHGSNHKKRIESTAYIFANDTQEVLNRYHTMPGVRRNIGRSAPMPNISLLSEEEARSLEKLINEKGKNSLGRAKKTWYYEKLGL
jgi:hypothetical protein